MCTLKDRSSTLVNGFINTVCNNRTPSVVGGDAVAERVARRNSLLQVNSDACFYCGATGPVEQDHLVATCNSKEGIFGMNTHLNKFPACSSCNRKKGNKSVDRWLSMLQVAYPVRWTAYRMSVFRFWISTNRTRLEICRKDREYILQNKDDVRELCHLMHWGVVAGMAIDDIVDLQRIRERVVRHRLLDPSYY